MKKFFGILLYPIISLLITNIDIIFGWDYTLIGDRENYLKHVSGNSFSANYTSFFSLINFEYLWFQLLNLIKLITFNPSSNFVLRIVIFISSLIFLYSFKRRTNSLLYPIFIILMPGVFGFYVVKLRHGLALALFAYLSSLKNLKFKNIYYLLVCMIHNSFILSIPIYVFGLRLNQLNLLKSQKFFVNITFFFGGVGLSFLVLDFMKYFGIRQYNYISTAVENADFSSFGLYRIAILIIVISLSLLQIKSHDSDSIIYSSSFVLGISFFSFLGGRLLSTMLPFLISELIMSRTEINKKVYWLIRFLIISIFIYGWILNFSKVGFGFLVNR